MENEGGRLGYDPVPGREGAIAINDYSNVDEDLAEPVQGRAGQAQARLTRCADAPELVYFDQWTDPVAGRSSRTTATST